MNSLRILMIGLALTIGVGCAPSRLQVSGSAYYEEPRMAYVDGLWVVLGQDYPLFYDDGYYWRWYDGRWLRSPDYDRGYVRVRSRVVPPRLLSIDRPRRYVRYSSRPGVQVRRVPTVRDHRSDRRNDRDRRYDRDRRNDRDRRYDRDRLYNRRDLDRDRRQNLRNIDRSSDDDQPDRRVRPR